MNKNIEISIRSSAAEYLTFVAATGDNPQSIEMRYEDENIWLTQKLLATLYDVDIATINEHLKNIFEDKELSEGATIRNFLIVQIEGNRQVQRKIKHYNLQAIIALGFKVNNERAVQFRKWANSIVKQYTIQGWVMDVERLKNGGSVLTENFFEQQLQKIREIRISERKFYQKITDLYATATDCKTYIVEYYNLDVILSVGYRVKSNRGIPLGMCRSVEWNDNNRIQHPVRDASLAGCKGYGVVVFSTERCIPNGIRIQNINLLHNKSK
jgi:hypothetical protein